MRTAKVTELGFNRSLLNQILKSWAFVPTFIKRLRKLRFHNLNPTVFIMTNFTKLATVSLAIFASTVVSAQTYSGFSDASIVLKADSTTRSTLITNLLADRVGDMSPIIGTAAWAENNKKLQCRSLIAFDYGILPKLLKPEQIVEAQLILRPVEFNTVESINGVPSPKFHVQRIVEPWEDSLTSWLTQPASEVADETVKQVDVYRKRKTVKIDVTEIVKNMFRYGNNGFMIRNEDSLETAVFISQWFASAKNEDEKLRPQLVIKWSYAVVDYYNTDRNFVDMALNGWRRTQLTYQQPMGQPVYNGHEPVPAPVIPNDNPPPPPPKTPVKD